MTLPAGNGTNFEYIRGYLPDPGKYILRMKLVDDQNRVSYTRPAVYYAEPVIAIGNITAKYEANGTTTLTVNTAAERFINALTIFYSTADNVRDSSRYQFGLSTTKGRQVFTNNPTPYTFSVYGHPQKLHFAIEYDKYGTKVHALKTVVFPAPAQPLSIYPNPANSGNISFDMKGYTGKTLTATLTNINGRPVTSQQFTASKTGNYHFNTTAQPGLYVLNIQGDDGTVKSGKVLVE